MKHLNRWSLFSALKKSKDCEVPCTYDIFLNFDNPFNLFSFDVWIHLKYSLKNLSLIVGSWTALKKKLFLSVFLINERTSGFFIGNALKIKMKKKKYIHLLKFEYNKKAIKKYMIHDIIKNNNRSDHMKSVLRYQI